jgi:hypothetical protein
MSSIFTYSAQADTLTPVDGMLQLAGMITFPENTQLKLQCQLFTINTSIPNIFKYTSTDGSGNYNNFNNGLINLSKDGGVTWTSVQLRNGLYSTVAILGSAINAAVASWWADPTAPGFIFSVDVATQLVNITIDSTKLASAGQLAFDLGQSQINVVLGYITSPLVETSDGIYVADDQAHIDWFGDNIIVSLGGLGPLSVFNGQTSEIFFTFAPSNGFSPNATVFQYPLGIPSPVIECPQHMRAISRMTVKVQGSRKINGVYPQILLFNGSCVLSFSLTFTPAR